MTALTPPLAAAALTAQDVLACPTFWGLLFSAIGLWFLIPGGPRRYKWFGGLLAAVGAICLFADLGWLDPDSQYSQQALFWLLAGIAVVGSVGTISSQSPVYAAVWFALSLLGTAGFFLMQGAQFLGVATIVVYAGAIVVTFLFVLMLAQPEGHSAYDRITWGTGPTVLGIVAAGALVGLLTHSLGELKRAPAPLLTASATAPTALAPVQDQLKPVIPEHRRRSVLQPQHMAGLGAELFTKQLIAVEIGGTLLLVALVGAVGMVIQGKLARQEQAL